MRSDKSFENITRKVNEISKDYDNMKKELDRVKGKFWYKLLFG